MKNVVFTLAFLLIGTFAFANSTTTFKEGDNNFKAQITITESYQKEASVVSLTFNSKTEFDNSDMAELSTLVKGDCDITVTVSVGVGSPYVKITLTKRNVDCKDIVKKAKKLKKDLQKAL